MSLSPGTRLGPYEVVSLLGTGGMGEVYRARDARLGRKVALKVRPEGFASDAERLRRFEQEARAAGALNHPNVVAVFDVGRDGGAPSVVSELIEGETLRERMPRGMSVKKALEMGPGPGGRRGPISNLNEYSREPAERIRTGCSTRPRAGSSLG